MYCVCYIRQAIINHLLERFVLSQFERNVCEQIPHLRRYAYVLSGDVSRADDLVQDCLERALKKRNLWRRSGSLKSWLFKMLYRLHINHVQSAPQRREVSGSDSDLDRPDGANQEWHIACQQALQEVDGLPADQRDALLLMVLEGPSYSEAADILGVKVGTLRSRLARARDALRQAMPSTHEALADASDIAHNPQRLRRVK